MQVEKVSYNVNWKAFKSGTSFFIPCLSYVTARKDVRQTLRRLRIKAVIKVCIEDGIRGLRIWRI